MECGASAPLWTGRLDGPPWKREVKKQRGGGSTAEAVHREGGAEAPHSIDQRRCLCGFARKAYTLLCLPLRPRS